MRGKDVPHQLCHFHYLREAATPIFEAGRHAKTRACWGRWRHGEQAGSLGGALAQFRKVTRSYWRGYSICYKLYNPTTSGVANFACNLPKRSTNRPLRARME